MVLHIIRIVTGSKLFKIIEKPHLIQVTVYTNIKIKRHTHTNLQHTWPSVNATWILSLEGCTKQCHLQ